MTLAWWSLRRGGPLIAGAVVLMMAVTAMWIDRTLVPVGPNPGDASVGTEARPPPRLTLRSPLDGRLSAAQFSRLAFEVVAEDALGLAQVAWWRDSVRLGADSCTTPPCGSMNSTRNLAFDAAGNFVVRAVARGAGGGETDAEWSIHVPPATCAASPCGWDLRAVTGGGNASEAPRDLSVAAAEDFRMHARVAPLDAAAPSLRSVRWESDGVLLREHPCEVRCDQALWDTLLWRFDQPGTHSVEAVAIGPSGPLGSVQWTVRVNG